MSVHYLNFTAVSSEDSIPSYHPAVKRTSSSSLTTDNTDEINAADSMTDSISDRDMDSPSLGAEGSGSSSVVTTIDSEQDIILSQFDVSMDQLRDGGIYYLLDASWWNQYKDKAANEVSPIDNSSLLDTSSIASSSSSADSDTITLRAGLEQDVDYIVLSPEAWRTCVGRFGGGPAIPRQAARSAAALSLLPPAPVIKGPPSFSRWTRLLNLPDCGFIAQGSPSGCFVCRRAGRSRCKRCSAVYYCSVDCQTAHWTSHKRWCDQALRSCSLAPAAFRLALGLNRRGVTGITNLGNTCFLSAGLQCLSHILPLTSYFLSGEYKKDVNVSSRDGTNGRLAGKYEMLLRDLWFADASTVSPSAIKAEMGLKDSIYRGLNQQDAHEFIERFLDWLQEDVNRVLVKPYVDRPEGDGSDDIPLAVQSWRSDKLRNDSLINEVLGGQMRSQLQCPSCDKLLVRFDYFHTMQLALPHSPPQSDSIIKILFIPDAADFQSCVKRPIEAEVRVERGDTFSTFCGKLAALVGVPFESASDVVVVELSARRSYSGLQFEVRSIVGRDEDVTGMAARGTLAAYYTGHSAGRRGRPLFVYQTVVSDDGDSESRSTLVGFPILLIIDEKLSFQRMRFQIWLAVRRCIKTSLWRALLEYSSSSSALGDVNNGDVSFPSSDEAVSDVRVNMKLAARVPMRVSDLRGRILDLSIPPSSASLVSMDSMASFLLTEHLCDNAPTIGGTDIPSDTSSCLRLLEIAEEKTEAVPFISVVWSDGWLKYLNVDELLAVTRPIYKPPSSSSSSDITLEQCLRLFSAPEMLDEQNSWYCGNCKQHRRAMKTVKLWRLPEVLVLTLKRFEVRDGSSGFGWSGGNVKIEAPVNFPLNGLDVKPFCHETAPDGEKRTLYDLFAVCNHYGRMGFGHYTAFARDWDGKGLSASWRCFDDNSVEACSEEDVKGAMKSSYILFYRRRAEGLDNNTNDNDAVGAGAADK